nr:ribonuclease H-like domain-containing protein [Tanacetum cinerariifolium]
MTHPHPHRHVVPTTVLTRSRLVPLTAARPVTTAVPQTKVQHQRPTNHGFNKAHSPIRRPINRRTSPKNSNFHPKVTTVKRNWIQVSYGLGPQKTLTFLFDVHGNPHHALQDKGVIDSGCSRHMTGNISYLSDFEELNGGYVAFGGNAKGDKITCKGKIRTGKLDFDDVYFVKELKFNLFSVSQMCDKKNSVLFIDTECIVLSSEFKLPDENHVLFRFPRENNMYNVDLKNIVPLGDLTCLFAKATLDESNLWHRRMKGIKREYSVARNKTLIEAARTMLADLLLPIPFWAEAVNTACYVQNRVLVTKPHNKTPYELLLGRTPSIGFMRPFSYPVTILNILDPRGKFNGKADEGFLVGYSVSSTGGKEADFVQQYMLLPLWYSGFKDPQNTDAAAFKVKELESIVHVSPSRVRNLSDDFEEFFDNRTNWVNAASTLVTAVMPNSTNNTNTFSAAGPSNNSVSLNFELGGKSSYVDPSQYPDDPDMPALEDITFLDDEEDVGAEADFSNLETNITARFEDPDYLDKVYKVVKALYGLHQAPRAWYETLANYLLENGFQRGKIDQTLFIKKQKVKEKQDGIFISQDKYVAEILRKFGLTDEKSANTPLDNEKPLLKDPDGEDVDVHTYKSMIGSLMYLTSS